MEAVFSVRSVPRQYTGNRNRVVSAHLPAVFHVKLLNPFRLNLNDCFNFISYRSLFCRTRSEPIEGVKRKREKSCHFKIPNISADNQLQTYTFLQSRRLLSDNYRRKKTHNLQLFFHLIRHSILLYSCRN
jgi:hypothetical protein